MTDRPGADRPLILGIAGGSGAGKSTVVRRILERTPDIDVRLIHHDSYYRDHPDLTYEERSRINYDHPDSLETQLLAEHLRALSRGEAVDVPRYDFAEHRRMPGMRRVEPAPAIIVDGILVLAEQELRELLDIRVYVETDPDLRFIRRLLRDVDQRSRSVESVVDQYQATVRPMHLRYVEPSRRHAHVIVPFGGENDEAVEVLVARLRDRIRGG